MAINHNPEAGSAISAPLFANGKRAQPTDEAKDATARKLWMMVELLRLKRLSFEMYERKHERNRRSFQRDLKQLRTVGELSGFTISPIQNGSYVELKCSDAKIRALQEDATNTEKLIGDVARAMGRPIAREMGQVPAEREPDDKRFFHIAVPRPIESDGSTILAITTALKEAWENKALVKFRYPDPEVESVSHERLVEPFHVLFRSGGYYLIGYDRGRRAWRTFAVHRFLSIPERAGCNNHTRQIPAAYASEDVLGFITSDQPGMEVTVELSRSVSPSVTNRRWQAAQRVERLEGGGARIVFTVSDPAEVARWAFGFGKDARIVSPPEAVRISRDIARAIVAQHETDEPVLELPLFTSTPVS